MEEIPVSIKAIGGDPNRLHGLLSGVCRLGFEDQIFVPDGEPTRLCWLTVSPAAMKPLVETLGPDWIRDLDDFHATFWGTLCWTPTGCGHLGVSRSSARMDELIAAQIVRHNPSTSAKKYNSLRERLKAVRTLKG